ncbi:MAG: amidohydrolase family protein [Acidobacteria bacterium]|nr:amidohydrolase family protein [Acidobacteriota bacterium]
MRFAVVISAVVLTGAVALAQPQPRQYDVVIINARLVDGTGAPARMASVGIRAGRIVRIGEVSPGQSSEVIDARSAVVAPGLVVASDDAVHGPGVTTVVAGTRGLSVLDVAQELQRIDESGATTNYATMIGHATVRLSVMGRIDRGPTVSELKRMKALVFRGIADGALGLSTDLTDSPGRYAEEPEIVELARVAGNEDGLYASYAPGDAVAGVEAVRKAIKIGSVTGMAVRIARTAANGVADALIDAARVGGADVTVTEERGPGFALADLSSERRERDGVSLEEAVRRLTSQVARQFGLQGRGEIRVGAAADLIVFDPARAGQAAGLSHVLVNGVVTMREGAPGLERAGQVLRRQDVRDQQAWH